MAFKMKGTPMQRNFGIGSPMRKDLKPKTKGTLTTTTVGDKKTYHIGTKQVSKEEYLAHRKNIKGSALPKKTDPPTEGEELQTEGNETTIDFTKEREMVKREKEKINRIEGGRGKANNKKKKKKKKLTIKAKNVFPGTKKGILD